MIKKVLNAITKGFIHGGIGWRKEFTDKNLNPDSFLSLPGSEGMLQQYKKLNAQGKTIFLNTLYRKYPFLRLNLE